MSTSPRSVSPACGISELTDKNQGRQWWREVDGMLKKPEAQYGLGWVSGSCRKGEGRQGAKREHWEVSRSGAPSVTPLIHKCSKKRHYLLLVGTSAAEELTKGKTQKQTKPNPPTHLIAPDFIEPCTAPLLKNFR